MARPLRIEYPGAWYHVMNRGANHQKIFIDDSDRNIFLILIGETCELWKIKVHAFCLMDNHYHLLIETPDGGLGRTMRHINGVYTQRFNREHDRDRPLFRGRYKAILVNGDTYLMEIVCYNYMNPVKNKNDIIKLLYYSWSSNCYYPGSKKNRNGLLLLIFQIFLPQIRVLRNLFTRSLLPIRYRRKYASITFKKGYYPY